MGKWNLANILEIADYVAKWRDTGTLGGEGRGASSTYMWYL